MKLAAETIRAGGLVAFPTETVYGLGANALDEAAVRRVFQAKGRPWASPLIVHVADTEMARSIATEWPVTAAKLAERFWPGPLTMVLGKGAMIPDVVTAGLPSVGIRIPDHPMALSLIRQAGVPVAAPSANPFSEVSPTTAQHVRDSLGDKVEIVLDGGPSSVGIESTVVALHRRPPAILRTGMISRADLRDAAGIEFESAPDRPELVEHLGDESPGQRERHYAPQTPLVVLAAGEALPAGRGRKLELPREADAFAHDLYAALHAADGEHLDWIAIEQPPQAPEWEGILDRLRRASSR